MDVVFVQAMSEKARLQEKEGNEGSERGLWRNSVKTQENPTLEEDPEEQRNGEQ